MKQDSIFSMSNGWWVAKFLSGLFIFCSLQGCCKLFDLGMAGKSKCSVNYAAVQIKEKGENQKEKLTENDIVQMPGSNNEISVTGSLPTGIESEDPLPENTTTIPETGTINQEELQYSREPKSEHKQIEMTSNARRTSIAKVMKAPLGLRSIKSHIIAGPNLSFKSSKENYGNSNHQHKPGIGFQVGVGSTLKFTDKWSANTGLLIKQNNASEELGTNGGSTYSYSSETKYSYTYLSAPVAVSYSINEQLTAFAGPELNLLLRSSEKSKGGSGNNDAQNTTKNSVRLGVGFQLGARYLIPDSRFGIQFLYDHRISRLNKNSNEGSTTYDVPGWHMKSFQLGLIWDLCNLAE